MMTRLVVCVSVAVAITTASVSVVTLGSGQSKRLAPVVYTSEQVNESQWIDQQLSGMSVEQKIGQMLQVRFYGNYDKFEGPEYSALKEQIKNYHIGSVVLGLHVGKSGFIRPSPVNVARVTNQLQSDAETPLLVAADIERGLASRVSEVPSFPWPMALGAAGDQGLVERFAFVCAREARAIGIHWALAPVADVNSNPSNPVINDRAFGEDPLVVSGLVAAYVRGAKSAGLLTTAKHFPGHGDSAVDSHRGIPMIGGNVDHLDRYELSPFRSAISAGVDSIMLAHARVPAIEPNVDAIATISSKVVNGLLRGDLGFKGVVVTDALEMKGITSLYDPKLGSPTALAAVDAVKAGCDVIMIPTDLDGAFHSLVKAVNSGEIKQSRIDDSVRRILAMKAALKLDQNRLVKIEDVESETQKPEDFLFAQHVADEAITLVRDDGGLLPLGKSPQLADPPNSNFTDGTKKPKLIVVELAEFFEESNGVELRSQILKRQPDSLVFSIDGRFAPQSIPSVLAAVRDADRVVLATYVGHQSARPVLADGQQTTFFGLRGLSGRLFDEIVRTYSSKTVVVALGSPYLMANFPQIKTYLCTYAMATTSEVSVARALFGEISNHAKLPVTLPGIAPRGFSLPWPQGEQHPSLNPR
jgi:beta-N-acetylhexosaminidase